MLAVSLNLPVVYNLPDILRAVLLDGWQFVRRIARRMAADCLFFLSSIAFTMVRTPYGSGDGIRLLIPPLVNGFYDGLRAVLLCGW